MRPRTLVSFISGHTEVLAMWPGAHPVALPILSHVLTFVRIQDQLPDVSTVSDDELDARLAAAEREALEARAGYTLRRAISNGVIMMNPALRAVHAGSNASPVER